MTIDYDYIETMGMQMLEGRSFAREFPTDTLAAILNEAAVRDLGFENPIGRQIVRADDSRVYTVIGVVENFHFQSLHHTISALVMLKTGSAAGNFIGYIPVRFNAGKTEETLSFLESKWREFVPASPFRYSFLDDKFAAFYAAEKQTGRVFVVFTALAIFVACLGLFGLAAFIAQKRTREIGVRKVLGATVSNVAALLSKDFVKLVLIANLIALPVAWYAMSQWLQEFAYRSPDLVGANGWWIFALAGGLALVIALLTVSTLAIRAALANPVESLRYE